MNQGGGGNERRLLDNVLHDGDDAVGDGSGNDGGGSGDEQQGTESDESKDTRSVAKPKLGILPMTPNTRVNYIIFRVEPDLR
jgi:hypothetical protein